MVFLAVLCEKMGREPADTIGRAAELEWEVPQVVVPIIHDEGQE